MSTFKTEETKENKSFNYEYRFNNLLSLLGNTTLLMTNCENIYYFTGFKSTASILIIHDNKKYLIVDGRYFEEASIKAHKSNIILAEKSFNETLIMVLEEYEIKSIALSKEGLLFLEFESIVRMLIEYGIDVELSSVKVSNLRMIKDKEEITIIKDNLSRAEVALTKTLGYIKEGVTEREIVAELEYKMHLEGGDKVAFDTICLFGKKTSLPHGTPSDNKLKHGDIILIDFGMNRNGYNSDTTRVFFFGRGNNFDEMANVYNVVLKAQNEVIEKIYVGMRGIEADKIARDIITDAGYGEYFIHGLGHGVGLQIHESPKLNPVLNYILERASIITIEPGIYLTGQFGIRLEDMVIVTRRGAQRLNITPTDLIVL